MKGFTFYGTALALIWSCFINSIPAQTMDQRVQHIHANLDKQAVQTGLLINQTPILLHPSRYDGQKEHTPLSLDQFGILYGQFRGAAVERDILPEPSVFLDRVPNPFTQQSTIVDLAALLIEYDYLDSEGDQLLEWESGQLHDVAGRSRSPYQRATCLAWTALDQEVEGLTVEYRFSSDLLFGNLINEIRDIEIDFDDGRGFINYRMDAMISIQYTEVGRKVLRLRYISDGTELISKTFIDVRESLLGSGRSIPYDNSAPDSIELAGLTLSLFSACADGKIRKPLIVVEGFGGNTNKDNLFKFLERKNSDSISLNTFLNTEEYDLIWVDYVDALASIETNAAHLIEAIDWINAEKHANGSYEPNVLIGASMGGLVGKLALLQMYNEQERDPEVSRFFTWDAPLRGANFPIGIQAFLRDVVYNLEAVGGSTASLQMALGLLDSPAAQDLIIDRVLIETPHPNCSGDTCKVKFSLAPEPAIFSYIDQLEAIAPLSDLTRHIAIANGADAGRLQEAYAGLTDQSELLSFKARLDKVDGANAPEFCYDIKIDAKAYVSINEGSGFFGRSWIYEREIITEIFGLCNLVTDREVNRVIFNIDAVKSRDDAPGGQSNLGLDQLRSGMEALTASLPNQDSAEGVLNADNFSFIPTVSALYMAPNTPPDTPTPDAGVAISRWQASNDNSVTSGNSGLPEFNQDHVTMTTRIADLVADELGSGAVDEIATTLTSGQVFNYGQTDAVDNMARVTETNRAIENLTIETGAALCINRAGRLGYADSNNPDNGTVQSYWLNIPKVTCAEDTEPARLEVAAG